AQCGGTDPVASYATLTKAVEYCRAGKGPALVHGKVIRPYSHSLSDDEKLYRPDAERQKDAQRDPITRMQMFLIRENILDENGINKLEKQVEEEIQEATDRALAAALPPSGSWKAFIYSPLAEANIVGRATGMATRGLKPVAEIQFLDHIWPAMHQLHNELPVIRWRSNNNFSCPIVLRVAIGGYLTGGAIYHSQSGESI